MKRREGPTALIKASYVVHAAAVGAVVVAPHLWPQALAAVAANHGALTAAGLWPRSKLLGPNVTRLPAQAVTRREVALTLDDGPNPDVTPQVLDMLDGAGVRATFFCIGEEVERRPALAREIVARGHEIENHSQHHLTRFSLLGPWRMRREIAIAQERIAGVIGRAPRFFRPTAGLRNPFLQPILADLGLALVSWTRRPFDTRCGDVDAVLTRLTRGLAAGDIMLMHDGNPAPTPAGRPVILEVLPLLLSAIRQAGLNSVTLATAFDGTDNDGQISRPPA
ncbi:MAG TPA: polysaccharide deacetylase family protein [Rhodocyclaceae bacterium]|nr:polysaccharide deacetylase family protein [Rhodocyclaceae bacterium]